MSNDGSETADESRGMFIVVEGPHQCGKSTQARILVERLSSEGFETVFTKEPFSREMSSFIRREAEGIDDLSRHALLFALLLDRCFHLRHMRRETQNSRIVVCDRYTPSTMVYQRIQGLNLDLLESISHFAPQPDICFFLHTTLEERLKRVRSDPRWNSAPFMKPREFELEQGYYEELCQRLMESPNVHVVEGDRPKEEIASEIWAVLEKHFQEKKSSND